MNRLIKFLILTIDAIAIACGTVQAVSADSNESKVVRVGFFAFDGYHMIDEEGHRSGYGYEYLQRIARYNDWTYEYVGYDQSWSEMQEMLLNGEIDLLTSAQKTPEREKLFDFSTNAIGTSATILTVKAGDNRFLSEDHSSYDGIRVGMIEGNSRNDSFAAFAEKNGFTYEPVLFEDTDKMIEALQTGQQIDAIVTSNLRAIENEWIIAQFDISPYYVIVKKGNKELLQEVNQALEKIANNNPGLQMMLFEKYYAPDTGDDIAFTPYERDFISEAQESGKVFKAVMKPGRYPLSGFENGEAVGMIAGIAEELEHRTGLQFEIVETKTRKEYNTLLKSDEIDVILDSTANYDTAEHLGYKITEAYMSLPFSALTKRGDDTLSAEWTVAAGAYEGVTERYIKNDYRESRIVLYDTQEECVEAVKKGLQNVTYVDTYSAEYIAKSDVKNQLHVTLANDYASAVAVGVKNTSGVVLLDILNKAVLSIPPEKIESIISENTQYVNKSDSFLGYLYNNPVFAMTTVAVFCALFVLVVISVSRTKQRKIVQEKNHEYERFISYVCRANDEVVEIDTIHKRRVNYAVKDRKIITEIRNYENFSDLFLPLHEEDRDAAMELCGEDKIDELIDSLGEIYFEARAKTGDGSYHWYAYALQGIVRDDEHPSSAMMFKRDIDSVKKEEAERQQIMRDALNVAQEASNAKGDFMSRMSHEIRTPLNAVIGYMTIAKMETSNITKVRDCIDKSEIAAKHLLSIINDVLDMSSIENGKMKIAYESFDLKLLMETVTEIFYAQARSKDVHFEIIMEDVSEEYLIGDKLRVNQVLLNLLSNAVKFTPTGGKVLLTVKQVMMREKKIHMRFTVEDTGIGMEESFLEKVFQPFEQQDVSISQNFGGTGLGLSITYNLINMMGGSIGVQSTVGKGTTFTVELPFGQDTEHHIRNTAEQDFSYLKALIVDDEKSTCEYMSVLMQRCGVQNETALTGYDAIKMISEAHAKKEDFNLCLMDWMMPQMDGMETVKLIRESVGDELPIVIVTAYDYSEIEEEAKKVGVNCFISKPVFQSTMFNLLVETYGGYKPKNTFAVAAHDYKGSRILLAEDNNMNMEIASEILKNAGFAVDTAEDGRAAVDRFLSEPEGTYQLILMDIVMPKMNGYDATKEIRASSHPQAKSIPIVAMTANAFKEDVSQALMAGMNNHISKPIDVERLFEVIGESMQQS